MSDTAESTEWLAGLADKALRARQTLCAYTVRRTKTNSAVMHLVTEQSSRQPDDPHAAPACAIRQIDLEVRGRGCAEPVVGSSAENS